VPAASIQGPENRIIDHEQPAPGNSEHQAARPSPFKVEDNAAKKGAKGWYETSVFSQDPEHKRSVIAITAKAVHQSIFAGEGL